MSAIVTKARAEIKERWRSLLALGLVIGLGAGFVIAAATGARRTDSALDRFLGSMRAADVEMLDDNSGSPSALPLAKVRSSPLVAETAEYVYFYMRIGDGVAAVVPADDKFGRTIDRYTIIRGRVPVAADEAAISLYAAQRFHLDLGSEIPFADAVAYLGLGRTPPPLDPSNSRAIRVVGVEAGPGELPPPVPIGAVGVHLAPSFMDTLKRFTTPRVSLAVRLRDPRAVGSFLSTLGSFGDQFHVFALTSRDLQAGTSRSFHLQANALWLLAGLVALVSFLIFGQGVARQASLEAGDVPTLRALGMRRGEIFAVGMARAGVLALFGAIVAPAVGYLITPLSPIGLARTVDPSLGFFLDAPVLVTGAAAVFAGVLLLAAIPSWRAAAVRTAPSELDRHASRWTGFLTTSGSSAPMVAGARFAFRRGRGRTSVPVRSSLAGSTIGISALVAALCFGAGLSHLIRTPDLYGWRWDYVATTYGLSDLRAASGPGSDVPGIKDIVFSGAAPLTVDGVQLTALTIVSSRGDSLPPIIEGRAPAQPGEIVLGSKALRMMRKHIGDTVTVTYGTHSAFAGGPAASSDSKVYRMRVVGRGVFPASVDPQLGLGALVQDASFADVPVQDRVVVGVALRFAPGADRTSVIAHLREVLAEAAQANVDDDLTLQENPLLTPDDVINFGQVRNLPLILAGLLAILAAATLAHTMASSIHRRARDLAVLKTLGFVRWQVRAAVAWQALFLAGATLLAGIPVGMIVGRWAWTAFADRVGVVPVAQVPLLAVLLCIPATIVLAIMLGVLPARSAAKTRPALVLRAE